MENNYERRYLNTEIRNVEDRTIQGTAIVFASESRDMGFIETISPDAISQELIDSQDVVMLYNHNEDAGILARRNKGKGTLNVSVNERGVDFQFKARKGSSLSEEVLSAVNAGDLNACSFSFRIAENGDKWENRDGVYYRTINKIEVLRDLSIVSNPAYESTSCRSFEKFKEEQRDITIIVVEAPKEEPIVEDVPIVTDEPVTEDPQTSGTTEQDMLPTEDLPMSGSTMEEEGCSTDKEKRIEGEQIVTDEEKKRLELKSYYDDIDKLIKEINL